MNERVGIGNTCWQMDTEGHNWTDYDVAEQSDYYGNKI